MTVVSFAAVEKLYDMVGDAICCRFCSRKWRMPEARMTKQANIDFLAEHYQSHRPALPPLDDDEIPF